MEDNFFMGAFQIAAPEGCQPWKWKTFKLNELVEGWQP